MVEFFTCSPKRARMQVLEKDAKGLNFKMHLMPVLVCIYVYIKIYLSIL